jgi:hypothetical protein
MAVTARASTIVIPREKGSASMGRGGSSPPMGPSDGFATHGVWEKSPSVADAEAKRSSFEFITPRRRVMKVRLADANS